MTVAPKLARNTPTITPAEAAQIARFKHLTERVLPGLAREHHWPIRLDHCFKRICLDHAFAGIWYNHLPRPAERHLTGAPLTRALRCAEELATGNLALLRTRNRESLRYRGKLSRQDTTLP